MPRASPDSPGHPAGGGPGRTEGTPCCVILLGPPAAGKGTQSPRVAAWLGLPHVATGDMFRLAVRDGTPAGRKANEFQSAGKLVPDDLVFAVVGERLDREDCRGGLLLDGFPRNLEQARWLDQELESRRQDGRLETRSGQELLRVIAIELSDDEVVRRLSGRRTCSGCQASYHVEFAPPRMEGVCDSCGGRLTQRSDDNPDAIRTRLGIYERQTKPLFEHYRSSRRLHVVSGLGEIEEISKRIQAALYRDEENS